MTTLRDEIMDAFDVVATYAGKPGFTATCQDEADRLLELIREGRFGREDTDDGDYPIIGFDEDFLPSIRGLS